MKNQRGKTTQVPGNPNPKVSLTTTRRLNPSRRNGHKLTIFGLALIATFSLSPCYSQEDVVDLSTTIIGNQEQPKVLYIVPWKSVNDSEREEQTIQSQLDIVFGHIERIELQRELQFNAEIEKAAEQEAK